MLIFMFEERSHIRVSVLRHNLDFGKECNITFQRCNLLFLLGLQPGFGPFEKCKGVLFNWIINGLRTVQINKFLVLPELLFAKSFCRANGVYNKIICNMAFIQAQQFRSFIKNRIALVFNGFYQTKNLLLEIYLCCESPSS